MMEGPPLQLMVDPDAKPVAVHTPVPVPVHWQDDLQNGLDRDVKLGVIEPVPVGEPVKWCHRMVVCAKKNGTQRRTVDLQALNAHATRDTHHTLSPSEIRTTRKTENGLRCLERVPQCTTPGGRQAPDHIHYPMGQVSLSHCTTRLYGIW